MRFVDIPICIEPVARTACCFVHGIAVAGRGAGHERLECLVGIRRQFLTRAVQIAEHVARSSVDLDMQHFTEKSAPLRVQFNNRPSDCNKTTRQLPKAVCRYRSRAERPRFERTPRSLRNPGAKHDRSRRLAQRCSLAQFPRCTSRHALPEIRHLGAFFLDCRHPERRQLSQVVLDAPKFRLFQQCKPPSIVASTLAE